MGRRASSAVLRGTLALGLGPVAAWAEDEAAVEEILVEDGGGEGVASVTEVRFDDARPASTDLARWLEALAGVHVRRLGPLGSPAGLSVRGAPFEQVQVFLDGVPLNPDASDTVDLSAVPAALLDGAWVHRGVAPVRYGSSAIGGVVDLRTAAARDGGFVEGTAGSFGTGRLAAGGGWSGPVEGLVAGEGLVRQGRYRYLDDNGTRFAAEDDATRTRENADVAQGSLLMRLRGGEAVRWSAMSWLGHRGEGLPGPIGLLTPTLRRRTTRHLAALSASGWAGPVGWRATGWHRVRVQDLRDPDGALGLGTDARRDGLQQGGAWLTATVSAHRTLRVDGQLQARGEAIRRRDGAGDPEPWRARGVVGGTLGLSWSPVDALRIAPSVDARWLGGSGSAVGGVQPRLVLEARPHPDLRVHVSAARTFRPPDLLSLFGDQGALRGNPDLRPERAWGGEVGTRWTPSWRSLGGDLAVGGFVREATDRITWIQNAQGVLVPVNLDRALVGGVEASGQLRIADVLELAVDGTWTESRVRGAGNDGLRVPYVPRLQVDTRLAVRLGPAARFGHTLTARAGDVRDLANRLALAPRVLHGLFAQVRPWAAGPAVEVDVWNAGHARTGAVPREPLRPELGSVDRSLEDFLGYPLPGTAVYVTVRQTLGEVR